MSVPMAAAAMPSATDTAAPEGGAAGDALGRPVVGVQRRSVVGVQAQAGVGELRHVGAANEHEAGLAQPPDRGGVRRRRRAAVQQPRAGPRHLPLYVEEVLDGDGNAAERGGRLAGVP